MAEFALATRADDAAIRWFLTGQPMQGRIGLELRTEPSFFAAVAALGENAEVLVARGAGEIAGLGVRTRRRVWLHGREQTIGHLSFLRVAEAFRRRREFLRRGFAALGDLQRQDPVAVHLTAILWENRGARRLLEAGLKGMPLYTPVADVRTFTLGTGDRRMRVMEAAREAGRVNGEEQAALQECVAGRMALMDGAPVIGKLPLGCDDFAVVRMNGRIVAAAAIWDQRGVRQWMVTRYDATLGAVRPWWNLWQQVRGRATLPAPGCALNMAYVSCLAAEAQRPEDFRVLLGLLAAKAQRRGIDYLVLSLARPHPLAAMAESLAEHVTESILYSVRWAGDPTVAISGIPYVEAGLL
jgi:hypothetical protein